MLGVGCFVATASIWGEAGGAQWPCLLLGILTKPTPGWLGVPALAGPGDRGCPAVPSAALAAWLVLGQGPAQFRQTRKPPEDGRSLWMGRAGGLVSAEGWVVHKAGFQVPHWRRWQEIQCLHCQVQPCGMLQETPWPCCVNSASQISVWTEPACAECCSGVGDSAARLSPAACWLFLCAAPAAALKSSCCGLGLAVLLRQ